MSGNGNNGREGKTFGSFPVRFEFKATASFDVRVRQIQKRTGVSRDRIVREAAARGILDTAQSLDREIRQGKSRNVRRRSRSEEVE